MSNLLRDWCLRSSSGPFLWFIATAIGVSWSDAQALDLVHSVIGAGGGQTTVGTYVASTTIGQPIVGGAVGGTYSVQSGFWVLPDPAVSSVDSEVSIPDMFSLGAIDPNPFTSSAAVHYALPAAVPRLQILVFDASGRRLRTLVDGPQDAGSFRVVWNGLDDRGAPVSSGVYFCQMAAGSFKATVKMVATR